METGILLFLKLAIVLMGIPVLALCIIGLSSFSPQSILTKVFIKNIVKSSPSQIKQNLLIKKSIVFPIYGI